ncbi:hypothetical protein KAF25_002565 [Fusarium avenaceum]|uniref:Alpha/beta hydrolase fold-3 domain-containing protein n=1 Tax=Fusarium avenaceum TaxID=40199 RepID=A0A9P7H9L8_9HYPO|nr:hypothetical protein KAF25_002565 [Fusarium avenaceum]
MGAKVLNFHGGAFMLGSSKMVNRDQVYDCLQRGWIVVAPNHRLCPQVDLVEGPVQDSRDLLAWVYDGGLQAAISSHTSIKYNVDTDYVFAFGTSSGGTLALCLGFGVPRPVAGIYSMYGTANFSSPLMRKSVGRVAAIIPKHLTPVFLNQVYHQDPVPTEGGFSLEGQRSEGPDFSDPRQAFVQVQIANGTVLDSILPSGDFDKVDAIKNISPLFPPTFLCHGAEDNMVPLELSEDLYKVLRENNVKSELMVIPGEDHVFAARMKVGSRTWNLQREGFDFLENLIVRA